MALTLVVLCALMLLGLACLATSSRAAPVLLLLCSALWLPVNNKHLEGAILLSLGDTHGLTLADVVGLAGAVLATVTLLDRAAPERRVRARIVGLAVLAVLIGYTAAFFTD